MYKLLSAFPFLKFRHLATMKVVQRPNISEWLEYVGDFVNVKLHKPEEYEPIAKALETQINSSWYQNFTDTFNTLFSNTYLVKLPTSLEIENANNSDHVCIETIIEHPEIMSAFKFWFNRFGVVSIKLFCEMVLTHTVLYFLFNYSKSF